MTSSGIKTHLAEVRTDHSLPRPFYCSPEIYNRDVEAVLEPMWHIAGLAKQIQALGDYFLFNSLGEEIILVRGENEEIHAFYNVCRHRGSRICLTETGNCTAFVCPYHAWRYGLDGQLQKVRLMAEDFEFQQHNLHSCAVRTEEGIIFVSMADNPPDFDGWISPFKPYCQFHGIRATKSAKDLVVPTQANWKLVVENFIECYHCLPSHPEYCSVHSKPKLLAAGAGTGSGPDEAQAEYQAELGPWLKTIEKLGHPFWEGEFDDGGAMTRMPIGKGRLTESRDGKAMAPLLGEMREYDGGVSYLALNYLNYLFIANDYAMLLRFSPQDHEVTNVEATWLVDEQAEKGVDYDAEELVWLWQTTLDQDLTITENNQRGVSSRRYSPGPYSQQEIMNKNFIKWYLRKLSHQQ
ncbi:MAG: aromatic ring-hydroxylating oxygenase subunit alpha [Pseudomonadales bacterium]